MGVLYGRMDPHGNVQFDSGWSGSENEDFRLSAPARPRDVPGAGRGAAGAPLGRVGAERRKSRFLGGAATTRAWIKLY